MKRNKKKTEMIILVISAIVLIISLLLPVSGKFALVDELFDVLVLVCIIFYAMFELFNTNKLKEKISKGIKIVVIVVCILFIGFLSKNLVLDVISEPKSVVLHNVATSSYQGYTGIFSSHYYVEGYDSNYNKHKIEISHSDFSRLSNKETINVDYFENTGRALSVS